MGLPEGSAKPASLSCEEVDKRIAERITGELQFLDGEMWPGIFALSKKHRKTLAAETVVMSVDGNTHRFMCNSGVKTFAEKKRTSGEANKSRLRHSEEFIVVLMSLNRQVNAFFSAIRVDFV